MITLAFLRYSLSVVLAAPPSPAGDTTNLANAPPWAIRFKFASPALQSRYVSRPHTTAAPKLIAQFVNASSRVGASGYTPGPAFALTALRREKYNAVRADPVDEPKKKRRRVRKGLSTSSRSRCLTVYPPNFSARAGSSPLLEKRAVAEVAGVTAAEEGNGDDRASPGPLRTGEKAEAPPESSADRARTFMAGVCIFIVGDPKAA
mmetsp:Transcript_48483/g.89921  ORF Transcript_48483/g.89921 Transcript_48483/m.89921 type:complete len:205 (+) Transcript_48483:745-1359(+)